MKKSKILDEVPITKKGLRIYIEQMEKAFKPVKLQYSRMSDCIKEAKIRYDKLIGNF